MRSDGSDLKLFGTDGIRGEAGRYPLDETTVEMIGRALAVVLADQTGHSSSILVGRDTRESGPSIERWLTRGARSAGASVESAGVLPTPGVAYITRTSGYDAGVVISASHNPFADNGVKVFSPSGKKLADESERAIELEVAALKRGEGKVGREPGSADSPSNFDRGVRKNDSENSHLRCAGRYLEFLLDEVADGLSLEGMRLAVDCANGAASEIGPALFQRLGADVVVVAASPNGRNINEGCGSTHPERLEQIVVEKNLDLGIALDGDADRALFVDETGFLVDGDHVLLMMAEHLRARDELEGNVVVATLMSNVGLEIALKQRGITTVRTEVGDRYVLEELLSRGARLGGEQSGHIIFPAISLAGDGLITSIEVMRVLRDSHRTLSQHASDLTTYPQVLLNVGVRSKPPIEGLPDVQREIERVESELLGQGRLNVRYSGTQPLARVMIEGKDKDEITRQAQRIAAAITRSIG
ncbi:MAG TPA: phosphoglucosamine mutase [Blastocatellia bacterium]|nr:phosphoglucosamine mutase [Blastocatellia bacterium]